MPNKRYRDYCKSSDFIRRHIFPGGHLPCPNVLVEAISDMPLHVESAFDLAPHYAVTLQTWRERFKANMRQISALGYTSAFIRKWLFYFSYCQAGFEAGYIYLWQLTFTRTPAESPTLCPSFKYEPMETASPVPRLLMALAATTAVAGIVRWGRK